MVFLSPYSFLMMRKLGLSKGKYFAQVTQLAGDRNCIVCEVWPHENFSVCPDFGLTALS